jgi:hypothetical protein
MICHIQEDMIELAFICSGFTYPFCLRLIWNISGEVTVPIRNYDFLQITFAFIYFYTSWPLRDTVKSVLLSIHTVNLKISWKIFGYSKCCCCLESTLFVAELPTSASAPFECLIMTHNFWYSLLPSVYVYNCNNDSLHGNRIMIQFLNS